MGAATTLAWDLRAGQWMDRQPLISMATWGGHHRVVAAALIAELTAFALLAVLTRGFRSGSDTATASLVVTCFCTVVTVAGVLALALPAAAIVVLLVVMPPRRR